MAHGIIIFKSDGTKLLDSSKRIARIVGWHDVNPVPVGTFRYTWNHTDLLSYGDLFVWTNPNFWFNQDGWVDLRINGGVIILEGNLKRIDSIWDNETYMRVLYGVKA
ncbi:hypothetical protein VP018_000410 [Morganella morganii]|nr:hypothetical protein [Morganella morganii]